MSFLKQFFIFIGSLTPLCTQASDSKLWYNQPATAFEKALPLGNGRLAVMVYGDIQKSHLLYNEDSL